MGRHQTVPGQIVDTRDRLIDTALDLIAERGYEGMSLQMVADATGVTKAALYYHFPSKSDLLDALLYTVFGTTPDIPDKSVFRSRRARLTWAAEHILQALTHERRVQSAINGDAIIRKHPTFVLLVEGMRERALNLVYGEYSTPTERAAFYLATCVIHTLPHFESFSDDELVTAIRPVIFRTLGLPQPLSST